MGDLPASPARPNALPDDVLCSGYMEKACPLDSMASSIAAAAGKSSLRTTNRFFVLRASCPSLEYFTAEGVRGQKKGALDLSKCRNITPDAQIPGKLTKPNTFALEIEDRIVYLNSGSSREKMLQWVECITTHVQNLERANNQGYTIRVQIHELIEVAKGRITAGNQVLFAIQCGAFRFKTAPRGPEDTIWDDALFDFHSPILPARVVITLCEKQNLFGANFGGLNLKLKILGEVTLQLTDQHTHGPRDVFPLKTSTDSLFGKVCLSWEVTHNAAVASLSDMVFTKQPTTTSAAAASRHSSHSSGGSAASGGSGGGESAKKPPLTVFTGTWNLGNGRPPMMNSKNGLGFLDAAFPCDVVAVGVQESMYTTEMLREALKENPEPQSPSLQWTMVDLVSRLRAEGGIAHKLQLVDKKKRKTFMIREAVAWLVHQNVVASDQRALAIIKTMQGKDLLTQISEAQCMWNLDDGTMTTVRWLEVLAGQRRQELDEYTSEISAALDNVLLRERRDNWLGVLQSVMEENFNLLASEKLLEMSLAVFVHKRHAGKTITAETASEATGLAGLMPNKGGICVRLTIDDINLAFFSAHLAAHDEREYVLARNSQFRSIMKGARVGLKDLDVTMQCHHVFFMGDLNYRIDLHLKDDTLPAIEHEAHWQQIVDLVTAAKWDELLQADQLRFEQRHKRAFHGFREGCISFAPTFKVLKGQDDGYTAKRLPSYCDRVLFHSMPSRAHSLHLLQYSNAPRVNTSDHKPVFATFAIDPAEYKTLNITNKEARSSMVVEDPSDPPFTPLLLFSHLCFQGLNDQRDTRRRLFIAVYGPEIFDDPRAFVKSQRINVAGSTVTARHTWREENIPPIVCKPVPHSLDLASRHVVLCVYEQAFSVGKARVVWSEQLGAVALTLRAPCLSRQPWRFQVELTKFGLPTGVLSGELSVHRCVLDLDDMDGTQAAAKASGTVPKEGDMSSEPQEPGLETGADGEEAEVEPPTRPASDATYLAVVSRYDQTFESDDEDDTGANDDSTSGDITRTTSTESESGSVRRRRATASTTSGGAAVAGDNNTVFASDSVKGAISEEGATITGTGPGSAIAGAGCVVAATAAVGAVEKEEGREEDITSASASVVSAGGALEAAAGEAASTASTLTTSSSSGAAAATAATAAEAGAGAGAAAGDVGPGNAVEESSDMTTLSALSPAVIPITSSAHVEGAAGEESGADAQDAGGHGDEDTFHDLDPVA